MEWHASAGAGDGQGQVDNPGLALPQGKHKTDVKPLKPGGKGSSLQYGKSGWKSRLASKRSGKADKNIVASYPTQGNVAPLVVSHDAESLQEMARTLGAAKERWRIARDLHDHAGQYFVGIMLRLTALEVRTSDVATRSALRDLRVVLDQLSNEMRVICAGKRCGVPRGCGLVAALESLAQRWEHEVGIVVRFDCEVSDGCDVDDATAEAVFRIVQEALTNVAKHATQASLVSVRLQLKPDMLELEVEDDGAMRSAWPRSTVRSVGQQCGIIGMRERVGELGGIFSVREPTDKGMRIVATIPLDKSPARQTGAME